MSRRQQLAVAVVLANRLVEAIERGAVPGDGTSDGQLTADVLSFAEARVGAGDVDETRDRLLGSSARCPTGSRRPLSGPA